MTRYNYKYLFEAIIIFSILTISGCGQKVSRNYGTSIDEDTSVLSAENSGNNISNSLDIEYSQDSTVNAKIYSQEDYESFKISWKVIRRFTLCTWTCAIWIRSFIWISCWRIRILDIWI